MPSLSPVTIIEQLLALPEDGQRHELLDGVRVVTPSPRYRHQLALIRLAEALLEGLQRRAELQLFTSPADIILGPRTLVQPDLFVIRIDPAHPPESWEEVGVPVLAIEVLSPTTAPRDRGAKRRIYQAAEVGEYWIADPDARLVERWLPADARRAILTERLPWTVDGETGLDLPLAQRFGR